MCDCFHLAFPKWHTAPGTAGAGRRLQGRDLNTEDDSQLSNEPAGLEESRPRPQGSSPVEEFHEGDVFSDGEKEGDLQKKRGKSKKRAGLGSLFDKRSTPKMNKLKEIPSPEPELIVQTAADGGAEGLIVGGGGKEGIFIKQVIPESPASKNLPVKEGDQILSATVYFDNVTYEDALQILEHAQAYKVKLCLKRQPDVTEEDAGCHPETIQEEEVSSPEMRGQRKTRKPGEARISWPKFPSFGKGKKKSHFGRSRSTSEAEEQTKLELSPTTSDTESPIKSQEAVKGKKKHKVKLSLLRNKGQTATPADLDTDTLTTPPLSGVHDQPTKEVSPVLSLEPIESLLNEPTPVYITHQFKVPETTDLKVKQDDPYLIASESQQHKVELVSLDSTLKTADITGALMGQESATLTTADLTGALTVQESATLTTADLTGALTDKLAPEGKKKKKKEKSELKMTIKGKDKSHKEDSKVKSSPKRLQTLGASIELTAEDKNKGVTTNVTLHSKTDMPQIVIDTDTQVSNGKGVEVISAKPEPTQVEKDLPKVELSLDVSDVALLKTSPKQGKEVAKISLPDIAMEEKIQKTDMNEGKIKRLPVTESLTMKQDPYDRLSQSSPSKSRLPKREDIEIPGMEDVSLPRTSKQGLKETKAITTGSIEAETLQMSIDVESVKEAVSKLPGFKLPKVDMAGIPIPEEITMIDANAQRITVKTQSTPTKVLDTKTKEEDRMFSGCSGLPIRLPFFKPDSLVSHEIMTETKVDLKDYKADAKQSDVEMKTEINKREDILIPGEECTAQDKANKLDSPILKESDQQSKKEKMVTHSFGVAKPELSSRDVKLEVKGSKVKMPHLGLSTQKVKGPKIDLNLSKKEVETKMLEDEGKLSSTHMEKGETLSLNTTVDVEGNRLGQASQKSERPKIDVESLKKMVDLPDIELTSAEVHCEATEIEPRIKISPFEFKIPTFKSDKFETVEADPQLETDLEIRVPKATVDIAAPEKPSIDVKSTGNKGMGTGSKFKMGLPMRKVKGPEVKLGESKTDFDTKLPEAEAGVNLRDIKLTSARAGVKTTEVKPRDIKGYPSKSKMLTFKLPTFGIDSSNITAEIPEVDKEMESEDELKARMDITVPKVEVEGPHVDLSVSKTDVDITLPEAKAEVSKPGIELPSAKVESKGPEIKHKDVEGSLSKFKMPSLKFPKFGDASSNITAEIPKVDKDMKNDAELKATMDITGPKVEVEGHSFDIKGKINEDMDKGSKFKKPSLGLSMPKVEGPRVDLSVSKTDVDITLPEAKAEVNKSGIDLPSAKVEFKGPEIKHKDVEGSVSKFKMPSLKFPKFGDASSNITAEIPEVDKDMKSDAELKATMDIIGPKVEVEGPSLDIKGKGNEGMGKGSKFKMPSLGLSMPKAEGPRVDLSVSKTDVDKTLPEAKAEVSKPGIELPSAKVEFKGPEIKHKDVEGSVSKFKMPSLKFPKFGDASSNITVEIPKVDKDMKGDAELKATMDITGPKVEFEGPSLNIKGKRNEGMDKGSKFKKPSLGLSMPKVEGPHVDLSVSKTDVDITLPEAKAEVSKPGIELHSAKVEVKGPEIKQKDVEGSLSKFKMPSLKFPKFGDASSNITAEIPEVVKDMKSDAELKATMDITGPKVEVERPSLNIKGKRNEGMAKGSKFKKPSLGLSMPKVEGPRVDLSVSKTDVDITLPESKAEVSKPGIELHSAKVEVKGPEIKHKDVEGSVSKFKMPSLKFPKFGDASSNITAEIAEVDKDMKSDAELKATMDITGPKVEVEGPSLKIKGKRNEGMDKGSTFKKPSLGLSMPKFEGPRVDLSVSKTDVDITLPEAKAEVSKPGIELPSAKVEVKGPEIKQKDVEGSLSKFKMPSLKFPKFGDASSNVTAEIPEVVKDMKSDAELKATMDITGPKVEVERPSLNIKGKRNEGMAKGSKFKKPSLGLSMPKVEGPCVDLSVSKTDVDITLPGAKAEDSKPGIELPSAKVELKGPEIKHKDGEGSLSKFKRPSLKFPKFGDASSNITAEIPEVDKDIKSDAELKATMDIRGPKVEGPSLDIKGKGIEGMDKGSKFKMPRLGLSMPKVEGPILDLSVCKADVDITLQEAKAEVSKPGIELPSAKVEVKGPEIKHKDVEGSPSTFTMPSLKYPKFGDDSSNITAEIPEVDKEMKRDAELKATMDITGPKVEVSSLDIKGKKNEGMSKGSMFKMPSLDLSMAKVEGPSVDLSVSKTDVDIILPEAKAEVSQPGIELPPAKVEVKGPEIKHKDAEVSRSRFKMPSFKFPKFGAASSNITAEIPEVDKEMKSDAELTATMDITGPKVEVEGPSLDIKGKGNEGMDKGNKFKMPSLGLSLPKVEGPHVDVSVSKTDVDITLQEGKAEVSQPGIELPSAKVEVKGPEIKHKDVEGSPSTLTMPSLKFPKFGDASSNITAEIPEVDKGMKSDAELKTTMDITGPKVEGPSLDIKGKGIDGMDKGSKFEMPHLGLSMPKVEGPIVDLSVSKADVDMILQDAKAKVSKPGIELPSAKIEVKGPEIKHKHVEGSPSTFPMPSLKYPKFGDASSNITAEIPEVDKDMKSDAELKFTMPSLKYPKFGDASSNITAEIPEVDKEMKSDAEQKATMDITGPNVEVSSLDIKGKANEGMSKGSKFKMPALGLSMAKVEGPSVDLSVSKTDVDITLPEAKAEVSQPCIELPSAKVEVKGPEIKQKDAEVSRSRFKMPSFKFPKFGAASSNITAEIPEVDKDMKSDAELKATMDITGPKVEVEVPSLNIKGKGNEGTDKGSKFKMPSLGLSMPKVEGPHVDVSVSKTDVDITLQEAKAEVSQPGIELPSAKVEVKGPEIKHKHVEGSPSTFPMPSLKYPKFGDASSNITAEIPEVDKDMKSDAELKFTMPSLKYPKFGDASSNITAEIPEVDKEMKSDAEQKATMDITGPKVEVEGPPLDIKGKVNKGMGKGSKFKMPSLGHSTTKVQGPHVDLSVSKTDVDITLPEAKAEVSKPGIKLPSVKVEVKGPEIKHKDVEGSPSAFTMPSLKYPKFGDTFSNIPAEIPEVDKDRKGDAELKATMDITGPKFEGPSLDIKGKGNEGMDKGSKFKMPRLGLSMPKVEGPIVDLSVSKADVDITLPEAKAEVSKPVIELPSAKVEVKCPEIKHKDVEGSTATFTTPSLKYPKFGDVSSNITAQIPEVEKEMKSDAELKDTMVITEPKVEVEGHLLDINGKGNEGMGKGSKFKMPSLGLSMSKVEGPCVDLSVSKTDVDITLPEAKAEVSQTCIELPSAKVEVKGPEIKHKDAEVPRSRFKMPSFKFLKFGAASSNITAEIPEVDKEMKSDAEVKATMDITGPKVEVEVPSLDIKGKGNEGTDKGSKFKMPSLGLSLPNVEGPHVDVSVSKTDVDITLQEAKAEVSQPGIELPSAKVEVKGPEIKHKDVKGSPSTLTMPSLKYPKFGDASSNITAEIPEFDKEMKTDAELKFTMPSLKYPKFGDASSNITAEIPEVDKEMKSDAELKATMPSLKYPKFGGASSNITAEIPEVDKEMKSDAELKFTMPSLTYPKFGDASLNITAEIPEVDKEMKSDAELKATIPSLKYPKFGDASSNITAEIPEVDKEMKSDAELKATMPSLKYPKFGDASSNITAEIPEVDKEMKSDAELKATVPSLKYPKFGDASSNITAEIPEVDKEMKSDAELKATMPSLKYPKFGDASSNITAEIPEVDKEMKSDAELKATMPSLKYPKFGDASSNITAEIPEVDREMKTDAELKFTIPSLKYPKFGDASSNITAEIPEVDKEMKGDAELKFTMPSLKYPKFGDASSNITAEISQPGIELPSAKVEEKGPEIKHKDVEGSPSTFTMPSLKFPKFGDASSNITTEIPEIDKDMKSDAELKATMDITGPKVEVSSLDIKGKANEGMSKGSKFKMPGLGLSMAKVEGPSVDLSVSKTDVDITLPEAKAEVSQPGIELPSAKVEVKGPEIKHKDVEVSQSRFKMPSFKFPKFGAASSNITAEIPEVDKEMKSDAELKATMDITGPKVEVEGPPFDIKGKGNEGTDKGSKFKMPSLGLSLPKVEGPHVDVSVSKTDVDITLQEAKAEVSQPGIELPSAKVEIKGPEIKHRDVEGSTSTFTMPLLKYPKFGDASSNITAEIPEVDKEMKSDAELKFTMPSLKYPKFGDASSNITAEISQPGIELPSAKVEVKGPEIKHKDVEGSPSTFTIPSLKYPKFGDAYSNITAEIPEVDKDMKSDAELKATMDIIGPKVEVEGPSLDIKGKGNEGMGKGSKFKMPSLGLSMPKVEGPRVDLSISKTLSEAKAEVNVPDIKEPEAKFKKTRFSLMSSTKPSIKAPDSDVTLKEEDFSLQVEKVVLELPEVNIKNAHIDVEGSPSTFTMPSLKYPKFGDAYPSKMPTFGTSLPELKGPEIDLSLSKSDVDAKLAHSQIEIQLPDVEPFHKPSELGETSESNIPSKDVHASPSTFEGPSFKLLKIGVGVVPGKMETDPDMHNKGEIGGIEIEGDAKVDTTFSIQGPSVDMTKMTSTELAGTDINLKQANITMPETVTLPELDLSLSKTDADVKLQAIEAEVKPPDEVKEVKKPWYSRFSFGKQSVKEPETEASLPRVEDSPSASPNVPTKGEILDVVKSSEATMDIKVPSLDIRTDITISDDSKRGEKVGLTPSQEEKAVPNEASVQDETHTDGAVSPGTEKQSDAMDGDANTKAEPVRSGWFKFPTFGLSSPPESTKKVDQESERSSIGDTPDEDASTVCSAQSSDAFADVSSVETSDHNGESLSFPAKVTVRSSGLDATVELGEVHGSVIASTTKSVQISFEPNLPENVTILSSGVSSSSVDTLKLESEKFDVIRSNIQAMPQVQQTTLLTDYQVQSPGDISRNSELREAVSWRGTHVESHMTWETSSQEKATVTVTQQVTTQAFALESSEPIHSETASSIQRLRNTVHSEKMKFFEGDKS